MEVDSAKAHGLAPSAGALNITTSPAHEPH